VEKIDNTDGAF